MSVQKQKTSKPCRLILTYRQFAYFLEKPVINLHNRLILFHALDRVRPGGELDKHSLAILNENAIMNHKPTLPVDGEARFNPGAVVNLSEKLDFHAGLSPER